MKIKVLLPLLFVSQFLFSQIEVYRQKPAGENFFTIADDQSLASVYCDADDNLSVKKTADLFIKDIEHVTGKPVSLVTDLNQVKDNVIIIGTIDESPIITELISSGQLDVSPIMNQW